MASPFQIMQAKGSFAKFASLQNPLMIFSAEFDNYLKRAKELNKIKRSENA